MAERYLIGLDYGSESARGVLIGVGSGQQLASHTHPYRHGIMTLRLPDGTPLQRGWALQNAADYVEAALDILTTLGNGRDIDGIGLGFTASSPMPVTAQGKPLSQRFPAEPHAYVKLWKHSAAQGYANAINAEGGSYLENFGGKVSGEWLLAKAAQIAAEAPKIWSETAKFIESGDWLVWQLSGVEARSLGFAAYKAQYSAAEGYPDILPDLGRRLAPPHRVGSAAGELTTEWRAQTGILGKAAIAVSVIDSHVVLPAVGAVETGCLVGALGTSAAYLLLSRDFQPLPAGIEGVAYDGSMRDLWCYESGQASFGDTLSWFVRNFPRGSNTDESFHLYNLEAAALVPGENRLVALDWWNGNRVPLADSRLSGMIMGLSMDTSSVGLYRALMESLCFGARSIIELFEAGSVAVERVLMTSGLAQNNPLLVQIMSDVINRPIHVPDIANPTAVGAAIHGAVASGLVASYDEGAARFGARSHRQYAPDLAHARVYDTLYQVYKGMSGSESARSAMHVLSDLSVLSTKAMSPSTADGPPS
ncbi:FGGY-family carbohydrate kinase [Rhizobium tumorigenes]|uniref:FGGY-family carbohydrate kinase n=1 Tax=Rhizobium tumorigenes TaxID=2041385 RepID=A0AAF1KP68_9HYPH|nr:FGGY-family carbohydrate kinase [Rhizobium tumorigenes]WFR98808.1 FGGY-family carbohydrate kinase [Rhizobium tumorigenes]